MKAECPMKNAGTSKSAASASDDLDDVKIDEKSALSEDDSLDDDEYWEEMLFISRGPAGWNIGCGCG